MKELILSIKQIGHLLGNGIIKERSPISSGIFFEYKQGIKTKSLYTLIVVQKSFNSCNKINLRLS